MQKNWTPPAAISIFHGAPLRAAADLMDERCVGSLVVVDKQGKAVGIVTDRDLCTRAVAFDRDPDTATVAGAMTSDLHTATVESTPRAQLQRMRALGTRRLPLVDGEGVPQEVASVDDALVWISERLFEIAGTAAAERRHGRLAPAGELIRQLEEHLEQQCESEGEAVLTSRLEVSRDALVESIERLRSALDATPGE